MSTEALAPAAGRAALLAGPVFVALLFLLEFQRSLPAAAGIGIEYLAVLLVNGIALMIASAMVGVILAFPTCGVTGFVLHRIADPLPLAREPVVWIGVGAGVAVAIVHFLFDGLYSSAGHAFIGTAMACAAIVRSRLRWE